MSTERLFTVREAAAVSGIAVKAVNNAIDKHIVNTVAVSGRDTRRFSVRKLPQNALVQLKLWHGLGGYLTRERREHLFAVIEAQPGERLVKADKFLIVDVGEARDEIAASVRDLDEAKMAVVQNRDVLGGEPVFSGTRIPVRAMVAMLDAGASEDEIIDGYPSLNHRFLWLARIWVAAHPPRGRPKSLEDFGFVFKASTRATLSV